VFIKFHQMLAARRRRRAFLKIRRLFASCGYPLDSKFDADIEAALPPGTCETPPDYIGAKTISRALRRLSSGTRLRSVGEADEAEEPSDGSSQAEKLRQLGGYLRDIGGRKGNKDAHERA